MKLDKETFKSEYIRELKVRSAKKVDETSAWDRYNALGSLIRQYISDDWVDTISRYREKNVKQVYYFSMEFLAGRLLPLNLSNLGIKSVVAEGIQELGFDMDEIINIEKDQGLGNGGLGRLAACFLDSMAALSIPGHGCGIRYNYGLFEQKIVNGYQVEYPDRWLQNRNVWEVRKADKAVEVKFGGTVHHYSDQGQEKFLLENYESVLAVPYDTPILGYKNGCVNTMRLWSAESFIPEFDYSTFSRGDFMRAFEQKHTAEAISQVLYPNDSYEEGKLLRLKQEYFFVSAGVQSIVRSFKKKGFPLKELDEHISIHINDTHPSLAIPELMRVLLDDEGMGWEDAWRVTTAVISYTNHTIMSEALEKWPVDMFQRVLPRIWMIVNEINERFCRDLWKRYPGDEQRIGDMAIVANNQVRMAYLAIVGSHSVNGVAQLHTEILKKQELRAFFEISPHKFNNKTNGITHRRWLLNANPQLSGLISDTIGDGWIQNPQNLRQLMKYKSDSAFQDKLADAKQFNKDRLAEIIKLRNGVTVDPRSIFDVHAKRLHEYKRQTLNVLHIMHLYNRLLDDPDADITPRTFIFAGKAAPGYYIAKQTIKLITTLGDLVNHDKRIRDKIKVIFLENYGVSLAEQLIPAADVSEQISTTTKEASGTGNMKFMMNGAITIATLDGANVEIHQEVGDDNIMIFGMNEEEVYQLYGARTYNSNEVYRSDLRLKKILDQLVDGFLPMGPEEFRGIRDTLLQFNDEFFVLKDFDSYASAQNRISRQYRDRSKWLEMMAINIACSGTFSSDKTISEYASGIWNTRAVPR